MKLTNEWFSGTAETENGLPIFISGRDNINDFRLCKKYKERVEIYWKYEPHYNGMPSEEDGKLMNEVLETLQPAFEKSRLALLTGIYTGDGERTLVFYTCGTSAFQETLNTALCQFGQLPLTLYVENDLEWNEYQEMCEIKPFAE